MNNFLFLYRNDHDSMGTATPEQLKASMQQWMDWLGDIAAKGKLVTQGSQLARDGKVVRPGNIVTDGPFTEIKELIGGYSIVKADSYDEAVAMAKGCPVLNVGGSVEVRDIMMM